MGQAAENLLEIKDLSVSFHRYGNGFAQEELKAIADLSLTVRRGEVVAVAGASGSGKSVLASAVLGILPGNAAVDGQLLYCGEALTPGRQRALRGREIALVPQSVSFLDPLMRVGAQADGSRRPRQTERRRQIFQRLGLPEETEKLCPSSCPAAWPGVSWSPPRCWRTPSWSSPMSLRRGWVLGRRWRRSGCSGRWRTRGEAWY